MELSQELALRILLVTLVAIIAIVAALVGSARIGRGRRSAASATFDEAILSSSYGGGAATGWSGGTPADGATPGVPTVAAGATGAPEEADSEVETVTTSPMSAGSDGTEAERSASEPMADEPTTDEPTADEYPLVHRIAPSPAPYAAAAPSVGAEPGAMEAPADVETPAGVETPALAAAPVAAEASGDAEALAVRAASADVETPALATAPVAAEASGDAEALAVRAASAEAAEPVAITEPETMPEPSSPAPCGPDGIDPLTGLLDAAAFSRLIADEDARIARYHHPATVVVFELVGFGRFVDRLGQDAGDRVLPAVATTIRRLGRGSDQVGRIGSGRFATLLPETDEVAAINYLERVRRACEIWLESGAIALRLAIGWAGTSGDPTLAEALRLATERMYAEARRAERWNGGDDRQVGTDEVAGGQKEPGRSGFWG